MGPPFGRQRSRSYRSATASTHAITPEEGDRAAGSSLRTGYARPPAGAGGQLGCRRRTAWLSLIRRFSEELYHAGRPRPEKAAQRLFFAVAHAYCKAHNLDLTPKADTGNGPGDFKVSAGCAFWGIRSAVPRTSGRGFRSIRSRWPTPLSVGS
jgi:hypothetical protein